jgi:hypothetical protein
MPPPTEVEMSSTEAKTAPATDTGDQGVIDLRLEVVVMLQQATLAIRARVPLDVLRDTIQPFPSFSEIHAAALKALRTAIVETN